MVSGSSVQPTLDPRAARTRERVLRAVSALLAEGGAAAVTHQRVAERAGVGRATVYRHWPTAADLLYDGLALVDEPLLRHGDGPLEVWLREQLRRAAVDIAQPNSVQFNAALMSRARTEPAAAALRDALVERTTAPLRAALARAVANGELVGEPDADILLAGLLGPLMFHVVMAGRTATDAFIDEVIDRALTPFRPVSRRRS